MTHHSVCYFIVCIHEDGSNWGQKYGTFSNSVVIMPQTILPQRNRRCALSATDTQKPEEKDARGVTYFMGENVIRLREVARFNEHIRN